MKIAVEKIHDFGQITGSKNLKIFCMFIIKNG